MKKLYIYFISLLIGQLTILLVATKSYSQVTEGFNSNFRASYDVAPTGNGTEDNVTLGSGSWRIFGGLAGNTASDRFNGTYSLRARGTAEIFMNFDNATGAGTLTFNYARYGTDAGVTIQVSYSTNGGGNWTDVGSAISTTGITSLTGASIPINQTGNVRVRFSVSGSTGNRCNIDDINLTANASSCTAPSTQASAITFSSVLSNSMSVNWTNGNGAGRVVKMNTTNSFTSPTDGNLPTANTVYGGSGEQVIYAGTGSGPVAITGLSPSTTYWFRVYEYCTSGTVYQTATATNNPNSQGTIAGAFTTFQNGDWYTGSTWIGGIVPTSTDNVVINHNVTATGTITRNSGTTTTVNAGRSLAIADTYTNDGTTTINGVFQLNGGGYVGGANDFVYATTGSTLIFNGTGTYNINGGQKFWPGTNYPENVTVYTGQNISINDAAKTIRVSGTLTLFGGMINNAGITINGTLLINQNGYVSVNSPTYGTASLLHYNTNTNPYDNSVEWTPLSSPNSVQLSGNTVLNYPNPGLGARTLNGNLTIDAGSALYMDYGSPGSSVGTLTVNNIVINGALSLGNIAGGDLDVKGTFTRTGTFSPNNRTVTFSGGALQSITGATTFDYLTVSNASSLALNNDILVNQTLTFSGGSKVYPAANILTIAAAGNIAGANNTNFVVTSGTGFLRRNSVGTTPKDFPVGNSVSSYTPLTLVNNGTTNDLSVKSSATIDNAVLDATRIVSLQWTVSSAGVGALADIVFNWNVANQAVSYNPAGTGDLGNYTTGPNYAVTNIGTMAGQVKSVTGIALESGVNKLVIGNTNAIYVAAPANDLCGNAQTLTVNAPAANGTTLAATAAPQFPGEIDVWYKFTAPCNATYTISTSTSNQDLDIYAYAGPVCPGGTGGELGTGGQSTSTTTESLTLPATAGVEYFIQVVRFGGTAGTFTIQVTGTATGPAQPGTITGATIVCAGSAQTYSISPVPGATSYIWTLPHVSWTGTSASTVINTTAGTAGGNISVVASNGCSGTPQTLAITVNPAATAPTAIAGSNIGSTSFTANWNPVGGAVGYFVDVYTSTPATDLIISEYVEGSGTEKYIEIFNGTGASVNLANYNLRLYANGSNTPTNDVPLSGTLANGATIVYRNSGSSTYVGATTVNAAVNFNGDDAVVLYKTSTSSVVDIFGRIGDDPGTAWTSGGNTTLDRTLVRNATVTGGVTVNPTGTGAGAFTTLGTQWTQYAIDNVTNLGSHAYAGGITYVPGYQNIYTTNNYLDVSGLNPGIIYYYVVRADNGNCVSGNSNAIPVTTAACAAGGITLNSFAPTSGPVATMVTIKGLGFSATPTTNGVKFGEILSTSYTISGDTMIIAEVPAGIASISKVRVANAGGCFTNSGGDYTLISIGGTCTMSDLIISEVYDPPSGNDHYIEIFNGTNSTINLNTPNNYTVQVMSMPGGSVNSFDITGTIAPGQTKVYYAGDVGPLTSSPAQGYGSGFNADDSIFLSKNGAVIDKMVAPNNTGYDWRRSPGIAGPNVNYTAAEWSLREENDANVTSSNIGVFTAGTDISFTTHPSDQTCVFVMTVAATGTYTAMQWKYYEPSNDTWQNVTLANLPGITLPTGATGPVLTIAGNIAPYLNYQFYCEIRNASTCNSASNAAQYNYFTKAYYKADILTATPLLPGEWTNPLTWLISDDNITYVPACTYPLSVNSSFVIIPNGAYVTHSVNQQLSIDKLTIENGSTLRFDPVAGLKILNGQAGADLIVEGTFMDRMSSGSGNGLSFEDNTGSANDASWSIANAGTLIKTNSSTASPYRDHYFTGIANIPATANWIYRHDPLTTSIGFASANADSAMVYPNLTLENTVAGNTYQSNFNATTPALSGFTMLSAGNPITIKGNFDVGGSGPGHIKFLNINTHSPVTVMGNTIVRAGDTLTNNGNIANNGAGFNLQGALTVNGTLINDGDLANSGILRFSGTSTQAVTGTGSIRLENVDIANSGATGTGVDIQRDITIQNTLSFAGVSPRMHLNTGFVTLKSTADTTARVGVVPALANITYGTNGRFDIERYVPAYRAWRFLSTPVAKGAGISPTVQQSWQELGNPASNGYGTFISGPEGAANGFDAVSPSYSMKWFDGPTNNYINIRRTTDSLIANDQGYMVFVRADRVAGVSGTITPANLRIKGQLRTGDQVFNLPSGNFHSIGNPYASAVDMDAVFTDPANAGIAQTYIAWDPSLSGSYFVGGYQYVSKLGPDPYEASAEGTALYGVGELHQNIQSGQAIFVTKTAAGATSVTFKESMKASGSDLVSRDDSPADRQFMSSRLYSDNGQVADGNFVAFDDEFSNTEDGDDVLKFSNGGENWGMLRFGKRLAIEARKRLQEADTIFYNMSNLKEQVYKLKLMPKNLASSGMEGYFIDRFLNTQTAITLADTTLLSLAITSNPASKAADRFYLVFKPMAGPVPVTFVSVAAQRQADRSIKVDWKVANEVNIVKYEVERSANGTQFSAILTRDAAGIANYSKDDLSPLAADNFYRIKAIGIGGELTYSPIVKVAAEKSMPVIAVTPNPVKDKQLNIRFMQQAAGNYMVQLSNALGQVVYKGSVSIIGSSEVKQIALPAIITAGTYQVSVRDGRGALVFGETVVVE